MRTKLETARRLTTRLNGITLLAGAAAVLAVWVSVGCGSGAVKPAPETMRAFETAPAAVKQAWDKALQAEQANDYLTAEYSLQSLRAMDLNSQQKQAVEAELSRFQQRLYEAAEKGSTGAIEAVRQIKAQYKR